jgi:hypothetical protein
MAGLSALRNGPGLYVVSVKCSYTTSYAYYYKKRKKKWDNTDEVFEGKKNGKAVPLQACSGPEGSRKLRFPDFMTTAQDGGNDNQESNP